MEKKSESREKMRVALEQVRCIEAAVKEIKVALGDTNITQNRHEDEFTLIFENTLCSNKGFSRTPEP